MVTPYLPVPAPTLVPTRYGLYAAASVIDAPDGFWEHGTVWDDSDNCSHGGLWQPCCSEFAGTPSVALRPVQITVTFTATPAEGGGATLVAQATDDWTGDPIALTATIESLGAEPLTSDGVAVEVGVLGACDDTYTITVATTGPEPGTATGDLVVDEDCNGTLTLTFETLVPEPVDEKAFSASIFVYSDPFVVCDGRECPNLTEAQLMAAANQRLGLSEQRQVEQQLWRGPTRPHLAGPDTVVLNGGTAVSPLMAVALLEGFLADHYLGVGVLHSPRYTAGLLHREMQIEPSNTGPTWQTVLGTRWVFGSGYPTVGPDGVAPPAGQAWMYATGQIVVRRSPVIGNVTRNRLTGCAVALAERTVVVGNQCGFVAGVLVDYSRCDCPEPVV